MTDQVVPDDDPAAGDKPIETVECLANREIAFALEGRVATDGPDLEDPAGIGLEVQEGALPEEPVKRRFPGGICSHVVAHANHRS